ncbi:MAG TPA: hypothetical protein VNW92_29075 [Polyangiaceae bacterium]|jgi:hypothetical protein|nr:hypothetical protein [Polyangiaceae bacterium]
MFEAFYENVPKKLEQEHWPAHLLFVPRVRDLVRSRMQKEARVAAVIHPFFMAPQVPKIIIRLEEAQPDSSSSGP